MRRQEWLNDEQIELVKAFADCNMSFSQAARKMFRGRSGYQYQLNKVYEITGLDPANFYDLCKLLRLIDGRNCKRYRYYCIARPPADGNIPARANLKEQHAYGTRCYIAAIDRMAWGWVEYDRELAPSVIARCGLIMQPREVV